MTFYLRHQFEHNVEYRAIQFSRGNAKKSSSPSSAGARRQSRESRISAQSLPDTKICSNETNDFLYAWD